MLFRMTFGKRKTIAIKPGTHKRIVRHAKASNQKRERVADMAVNIGLVEMNKR